MTFRLTHCLPNRPSTVRRACAFSLPLSALSPFRDTDESCDHSTQVNIPAASGEMGVLANHVPSIEQLKPGLVEIVEEGGSTKQYFRTSIPPN